MNYREAVEEAIRKWKDKWLHWNKSQQSTNAVMALEGIIGSSIYDDDLEACVNWLIGQSDHQFSYKAFPLSALKADSLLYKHLNTEIGKATAGPSRRPVSRVTSTTVRQSSSASSSSSVRVPSSSARAVTASATVTVVEAPKRVQPLVVASSSVPSYLSLLKRHHEEWSKIEITDIPTATPGIYKYTEKDKQTNNLKLMAALNVKAAKGEITEQPLYWAQLGKLVAKHRFGRCYSCAGLAVYTLVMDPSYDKLIIAVVGNSDYDHQFVVVGTESEVGNKTGYVIDIWQTNLDNGKTPFVMPHAECVYSKGTTKLACVLFPDDRASLRSALK